MSPNRLTGAVRGRGSDCVELSTSSDFGAAAPLAEREPAEASGEVIDIVVAHIKRLARTASLEFALRVGGVVIHYFYDGDTDAWRSRGPKAASFRRLSRHPDLPLSPGSLYRCVAIFELCDRLKAAARWDHLTVSHLRLVLGLPSGAQERLLALANSNRWTVKDLKNAVQHERSTRVTSGGRRPDPPVAKSLKEIRKCLDQHRELLEQAELVSHSDVEQSRRLIEETKQSLERLSLALMQTAARAVDMTVALATGS